MAPYDPDEVEGFPPGEPDAEVFDPFGNAADAKALREMSFYGDEDY